MDRQRLLSLHPIKDMPIIVRGIKKRAYQRFILSRKDPKQIVFIVGCQRSGTTMLNRCFRRDFLTKVYGARGLSVGKHRLKSYDCAHRLKPYDEIRRIVAKQKEPLIIVKPLEESQNVVKLLDYFPGSKAIWIYRNYRDVACSHQKKFGIKSTMKNLRPIVYPDLDPGWASEGVSERTRQIVTKYFSEDISTYNADILFWYVRNVLFFELKLNDNPNVFLCKYKDIVTKPGKVMKDIYRFLDYEYPGDHMVADIHNRSVNLGQDIEINKEIEDLCANLLQKMDKARASYDNGLDKVNAPLLSGEAER